MGLSRGIAHVDALLALPNVEVTWLCEVDEARRESGLARVRARQGASVRGTEDIRRLLDDEELDALTIAAPNHWHAPATILACAAGKHVYVEKPGSHNVQEADWMVEVARRTGRRVQLGTQRRSWPAVREMMERIRGGVIGRVTFARCWYSSARGSIGRGQAVPVPEGLDYGLWQGPAPERPYLDNLVHYNWHWRWHWGGGELANNGVHALDLVCWGLQVGHPRRVAYNGGRYHFDDDQETPDTAVAVYDFGATGAAWDGSSCVPRREESLPFVAFYGEGGSVVNRGSGYAVYDEKGNEMVARSDAGGDRSHFENFVAAIRGEAELHAEIGEGQKAARLCHLGNIAYRTGMSLAVNGRNGNVTGSAAAAAELFWGRNYQESWGTMIREVVS
jgi:predicted dehydrogenase